MSRNTILLHLNGERLHVEGGDVFESLSNLLRYKRQAVGTKVVCEEGDCGSCTVLLGRPRETASGLEMVYRPVNSCIQAVYQLDCAHVVTIEGLKVAGDLNPVQEAMLACHGAQCGFCTPGFVVAMCGLFNEKGQPEERDFRDGLTGNLCRCTGYESILKAALSVDADQMTRIDELYPPAPISESILEHRSVPVLIESEGRTFHNPTTLEMALEFRKSHPGAVIVAGGTDVGVLRNKRGFEPEAVMGVWNIPGLSNIVKEDDALLVGATATLSELEARLMELIPEFHEFLNVFGSPQIRHAGTLAGNIANGSPIGDTLPALFVLEAEVELSSVGGSRWVNMNALYTGYRKLAMNPDEMITRVRIPLPDKDDVLKLYKVSRRKHLDISTFGAAILMKRDGDRVASTKIAYGGVGPVVVRLPKTEAFLTGAAFSEETFLQAGAMAREEVAPISDVRGSREYRLQLSENILMKFYRELTEAPVEVLA